MPDKNILLIAYYFPPLGMGGVGRPLALFRHLPEYGYNVHVVTVKNIVYPEYDYSLLDNLNTDCVHRTGSFDPSRLLYLAGKRKQIQLSVTATSKRLMLYPDMKRGWVPFAVKRAAKLIETINFDAVITTSPPPSAHLVGLTLKDKYNIPWIADFRDFWYSRPIEEVYGTPKGKQYAMDLKNRILKNADGIVCTSHAIKKYLGRGEIIYNAADSAICDLWKREMADNDKFTIGVLGTINDLCPIEPLFKALNEARKNNESLLNNLSIVHVGHGDRELLSTQAAKYNLDSKITFCGYLPKQDAIKQLAVVDLLYIGVKNYGNNHILPGRIFDYLISGKPVLGMVPRDSDAERLLHDYPLGTSFAPDNTNDAANFLTDMINGTMKFHDAMFDSSEYTHKKLASNYAGVIDKLIGQFK